MFPQKEHSCVLPLSPGPNVHNPTHIAGAVGLVLKTGRSGDADSKLANLLGVDITLLASVAGGTTGIAGMVAFLMATAGVVDDGNLISLHSGHSIRSPWHSLTEDFFFLQSLQLHIEAAAEGIVMLIKKFYTK